LKNAGDAKLVEIEIQKAIVNKSQKEEQDEAEDQMPIDLAPVRPGFKTPGKRKGEHQADDEKEKWEDQIIETEALPCYVLKLQVKAVDQGTVIHLM
jgi:hypothetical protein